MQLKIKRLVHDYVNTLLEPDVLTAFRAIVQEFDPPIKINENSLFTFLFGYVFGRVSELTTVGSKETREITTMVKDRLPEIKSKLEENIRKFDIQLVRKK